MARLVYICVNKDRNYFDKLKNKAMNFLNEIQPLDINPNNEIIIQNENSITILVNPTKAHKLYGDNAMIGLCYEDNENKWQELGDIPDGNFIIKREKENKVEILTDFQATKSLWYYFSDKMLIVSSSQRMIVHLLGSFELNQQAVMWMLSSGTLGYKNSWDKRIESIPAASILSLNKTNWQIKLRTEPIEFEPNKNSLKENIKLFDQTSDKVFSNIDLNGIKPILSITGGYDSRTVLLYLKKYYENIDLMTFGDEDSVNVKYSDLYVSKTISKKFNLNWTLYDTKLSIYNLDEFFTKFFKLGEGRIDLLDRISDGFWWLSDINRREKDVLFNGMEGFSSQYPFNNKILNLHLRKLFLLEHYSNINLSDKYPQHYHKDLLETNKTQNQYYYKIFQLFFIPYGDAALNEIQNCYIDVINPLLSKTIIQFIRNLPDKQRIGKKIEKELVHKIDDSGVPFADSVSVLNTKNILRLKVIDYFINEYLLEHNNIFPEQDIKSLVNQTGNDLKEEVRFEFEKKASKRIKQKVSNIFPLLTHKFVEQKKLHQKLNLDFHLLKYRMFIVLKMGKQLKQDATKNKGF